MQMNQALGIAASVGLLTIDILQLRELQLSRKVLLPMMTETCHQHRRRRHRLLSERSFLAPFVGGKFSRPVK